ncbi:hypothetical protein [Thalassobacillus hwangdonensis]|uniref:Uncharacterized protein n=1 Tax=Thalassobacillus hwangdonensis TaxID=546108 RepID=A0ABW3KZD3_9BACI
MRKWMMYVAGVTTIAVWTVVIVLFIQVGDEGRTATDHSANFTYDKTKSQGQIAFSRRWDLVVNEVEQSSTPTVIGTAVTPEWVTDVSDDGKLSIDTLLASLELSGNE